MTCTNCLEPITMTEETEEKEKKDGKRKKRIAMIAIIVAALVAAGIAAYFLLNPYDNTASSIKNAQGTTQEELDQQARDSQIWISVSNNITCDSATDTCSATDKDGNAVTVIDNLSDNHRDLTYTFALEDGTVIYESDLITPGNGIEQPKLTKHLDPGSYNITVTAQGHDVDSHTAVGGTVAAQVTLVVK